MKKAGYAKLLIFVALAIVMVSCGPKMKTQRVSLEKSDELAMNLSNEWLTTDTKIAVRCVLDNMEKHGTFQRYLSNSKNGRKLFISDVQNHTSEAYFPIGDFNDEMLNEISMEGNFTLIDASAREKILKEIQYQNDGMVKSEDIKKIGRQSGADLLIFGDIRMKPETLGGKTVKDYSVNIRATNLETGEEVFRTRCQYSKYSKQSKVGW